MKTYADAVDHAGGRRYPAIGLLLGLLMAVSNFALGQSAAQTSVKPQAELATLRAVMKRVDAKSPRPAKLSATQVQGNGHWETQDLQVAWLGVMRRLLPTVRQAHPDLIRYWVVRTEARDYPEGIDPDKDGHYRWAFAWQAHKLLAATPALAAWAAPLQATSDTLIQGVRETFWNSTDSISNEEREAKRRVIDLDGRRLKLMQVVQGMLGAIGELDPARNAAWKPLFEFLQQDAERQWATDSKERNEKMRINFEISPAYYRAYAPPPATIAHFEKLESINKRLSSMKPQLLENALAPEQTPMSFLEGNAREFISTQIEFDRALARALDSPEVRANPELLRIFDGMYDVWGSLERHEAFLGTGRWAPSVEVLIEVARSVLMANSWEWTEIDPETGISGGGFAVQRAGQTIDLLHGSLARDVSDRRLYAAVEVDAEGRRVWTHSSWILWKWITPSDLDDLTVDGRVIDGAGRRWLLPAGARLKSIRSLAEARAADAREIVVALDPAGSSKKPRGVAR